MARRLVPLPLVALVLLSSACVAASSPPAARPIREESWGSQARALAKAVAALESAEARAWSEHPTRARAPAGITRAIAALRAWDQARVAFVPPCHRDLAKLGPGLVTLARAVTVHATDPQDPAVHALARLGVELRRPHNSGMSILAGLLVASTLVNWVTSHDVRPPDALRTWLVLDEQLAVQLGAATLRCNGELLAEPTAPLETLGVFDRQELAAARRAAGLAVESGWFDEEVRALRAFGRETAARTWSVTSDATLRALIAERRATAAASRAVLVQIMIESLLSNVEDRLESNQQHVRELRAAIARLW